MIGENVNEEGATEIDQNSNDKPKTWLVVNVFIFYLFEIIIKEKQNVYK
jgi:hypothetical protein